MAYRPKHNYRSKDALERGDPDKKVMGRELSEDFEAISADLKTVYQELTDGSGEIDDIKDSLVWTQGEVDPITGLGGEIKPKNDNEVQAQAFAGDGAKLTGITMDQLTDVNADPNTNARDDLLIWNGINWVADDFAFVQTALRFKGGIAPTADAPTPPESGDLYVFDADGTLNASWGALSGTPVVSGKFVGYAADTHNRWYLLGDMADTGVMKVSPGTGINVDSSKPSEPVVSIDRAEVDTWYADKQDTEDRFIDIEGNITQIEGNISQIEGDITNIENNLVGNYEPKIDPKNTAFNKNFGTTAGTVSEGNHNHDTVYLKDAPKDGTPYQRQDGGWVMAGGGGGGGGGLVGRFPGTFNITGNAASLVTKNSPAEGVVEILDTGNAKSFSGSIIITPRLGKDIVIGFCRTKIGASTFDGKINFTYTFKNAFNETFFSKSNAPNNYNYTEDIYMGPGRAECPVFVAMGGPLNLSFNYSMQGGTPTSTNKFQMFLYIMEV